MALHPSCGLDTQPDWVIFNEFVLTTRPYIRTVSEVRPDWCVHQRHDQKSIAKCSSFRLIEFAANYFDLDSFPDGETKRALQRIYNKRGGKSSGRVEDTRDAKKRKTNKS